VTTLRRNTVDLHTHTARSDGVLEPADLYEQMRMWGSTLVAVTDHDTTAGATELLAAGYGAPGTTGPRVIVGVEINTMVDEDVEAVGGREEALGELHILGLGVDPDDAQLQARLERQRSARAIRLEHTLERLREIGLPVDGHLPVVEGGIDSLGRPHVARALVATGRAESVQDAFTRYLVPGAPAYIRRVGMGPREAIETIAAACGIASLAHAPWALDQTSVMAELVRWGLGALEVHYHGWEDERVEAMGRLADRLALLRTGGSDYHGDTGSYAQAQASVWVPPGVGERLLGSLAR
jgi:predicted metal-dependent phosphoesterase TrpH